MRECTEGVCYVLLQFSQALQADETCVPGLGAGPVGWHIPVMKFFKSHRPGTAAPAKNRAGGVRPDASAAKDDKATSAAAASSAAGASETAPSASKELGGPQGPEPTRYGDWERKGICYDF